MHQNDTRHVRTRWGGWQQMDSSESDANSSNLMDSNADSDFHWKTSNLYSSRALWQHSQHVLHWIGWDLHQFSTCSSETALNCCIWHNCLYTLLKFISKYVYSEVKSFENYSHSASNYGNKFQSTVVSNHLEWMTLLMRLYFPQYPRFTILILQYFSISKSLSNKPIKTHASQWTTADAQTKCTLWAEMKKQTPSYLVSPHCHCTPEYHIFFNKVKASYQIHSSPLQ